MLLKKQEGALDCGLFAIAYSIDICHNVDPSTVVYDQSKMHKHLAKCFEKGKFPRFSEGPSCAQPTRPGNKWEWELSKKRFGERKTRKKKKENLESYNKFYVLVNEENYKFGNKNKSKMSAKKASAQSSCTKSYGRNQANRNKLIVNLSSRKLTENEMNLLCKRVKFSPATRNYNKIRFVTDIINWFRNLRLREYFYTKDMESNTINQNSDRCPLNWHIKSDGNPSNNNEDLEEYINQVYTDIKTMVNDTKDMKWNNLSKSEQEALQKFEI